MHELSLCEDLMRQVLAIAEERRAVSVASITLRLGPLAGVEPELLKTAFTVSRAGTLAEDAELLMENQPVRVRCRQCGEESDATANNLLCRSCGAFETSLISGDELILARVELMNAE